MSTAPTFSTVLIVDRERLHFFYRPQKNWHRLDEEQTLEQVPSAEALKRLKDSNVLVVVSDHFNGHLQFTQENKKAALERESILAKLEEDFDIDTAAYHLDWQNYSVNRQVVQLAVTGVEQDILGKVTQWLSAAAPKKVWAMPLAWFVSTLKSVDPALIAIYENEQVHVSHHYLGVDDARILSLDDLDKYIAARRAERKETHLVYVAAANQERSQLDQAITQEGVTTQSLLEESSSDVLLDVVTAAVEKGQGAWQELWHYELPQVGTAQVEAEPADGPEEKAAVQSDEVASADENPSATDSPDATDESSDTAEKLIEEPPAPSEEAIALPVPTPPPSVAASAAPAAVEATPEVEPVEEVVKDVAAVEEAAPVEEDIPADEEPIVELSDDSVEAEEQPDDKPTDQAGGTTAPSSDTPSITEQLKGSGVKQNNVDRYTPIEEKRSWKGPILVFLVVMILTALVGGAVFWSQEGAQYLGFIDTFMEQPTPTPTPQPEATPTPDSTATDEAQLTPEVTDEEKAETSILVLNATGIAGLAGRTQSELEEAGWTEVAVGNATGIYNDADFVVGASEAVAAVLAEDLERELRSMQNVKEAQASNYDVVIILAAD